MVGGQLPVGQSSAKTGVDDRLRRTRTLEFPPRSDHGCNASTQGYPTKSPLHLRTEYQIPDGPMRHWRDGENLIKWVEDVCRAPKIWYFLNALNPSSQYVEAWEAQVHIITQNRRLQRREPLWLRGHREEDGTCIITLFAEGGRHVLRRGHIDGGHQEPDAGSIVDGPHVHFPTSVFREIASRGRSRVYPWKIDPSVSLREAILCFAHVLNITGQPEERPLLLEEN